MNAHSSAAFLQHELVTASAADRLSHAQLMGLQCIGSTSPTLTQPLPMQYVALPLLGTADEFVFEAWCTDSICRSGVFQNIAFRGTDALLFGVIELDIEPSRSEDVPALRLATENAYRQIFALLDEQEFPHLWRVWNYLPDIHAVECGLERYRQFNIGRHQAFVACGRAIENSPAASALGTRGGRFSVAFIAGRNRPLRIENPRQLSAFAYPAQYGPRSPTFTRAMTVACGEHEALFISGTASIVGHETVHRGDAAAQTRETIANLEALLEQANARAAAPFALNDLRYRVYIRHRADFEKVESQLRALIGAPLQAVYAQADVCREDLLLEIEAFALRPLVPSRA